MPWEYIIPALLHPFSTPSHHTRNDIIHEMIKQHINLPKQNVLMSKVDILKRDLPKSISLRLKNKILIIFFSFIFLIISHHRC